MLPIATVIATVAMIMGVGGALFFSPIFIILFPLIGVDTISPAEAIGAALITELFGFSSGLWGYSRKRLIDFKTGLSLLLISFPLAIFGSISKHLVEERFVLLAFAFGLFLIGFYSLRTNPHASDQFFLEGKKGPQRKLIDAEGTEHQYIVCNQTSGRLFTGIGGFFTGLISVGIGETTVSTLRARCGLPMKVASGTSVFVVTVIVLTASLTEVVVQGIGGVPWTLIMFTAPGVLIGGQLGPKIASRIDENKAEKFLIVMFFTIGIVMGYLALQKFRFF